MIILEVKYAESAYHDYVRIFEALKGTGLNPCGVVYNTGRREFYFLDNTELPKPEELKRSPEELTSNHGIIVEGVSISEGVELK